MRYDILLQSGLVFDGMGAPGRTADVAIVDGKIAAIEASIDPSLADRVIVLSPRPARVRCELSLAAPRPRPIAAALPAMQRILAELEAA